MSVPWLGPAWISVHGGHNGKSPLANITRVLSVAMKETVTVEKYWGRSAL